MKKFKVLSMVLILAFVLAGCGTSIEVSINKDASKTTGWYKIWLNEKEALEEVKDETELKEYATKERDGMTFYNVDITNLDSNQLKQCFQRVDDKCVIFTVDENINESTATTVPNEFNIIEITFPDKIVETNGSLSSDKKTVVFDYDNIKDKTVKLYAYTDTSIKNISSMKFSGVANGKYYKLPKSVKIDTDGIVDKVTVTRDGKTVEYDSTFKVINDKMVHNNYDTFYCDKNGKYTVTATVCGKTKKVSFTIDNVAPTTNIKNNGKYTSGKVITFKDKTSGVSKATLDGNTIKSGAKVTKTGKHVLIIKDKAGNRKVVYFTISKKN